MKHNGRMMAVSLAVIATLALGATAAFGAISATTSAGTSTGATGLGVAASTSASSTAPPGAHGPGGPGGRRGGRGGMMGAGLVEVVSKLTGETTSTILTARQSGTAFADIAKAKGVTVAEIIELASHAPKAALDSQVADGLITAAQAKVIMSDLRAHWTEELTSNATGPGTGGHGPDGRHAGQPPSASDSASGGTSSSSSGTSSSGTTSNQTTVMQ